MRKEYTAPQTRIVTLQTTDNVMDDINFGTGSDWSEGEAPSKGNNDFDNDNTAWDE